MPYDSFLEGWNPVDLKVAAQLLGAQPEQLVSIKLRPISYSYKYEPPPLLTSHMPDPFYLDWHKAVQRLGEAADVKVNGSTATKLHLRDGSAVLVVEHESGPEIILWLAAHPEATAAIFTAIAAGFTAVAAPISLAKTSLEVLKAYLELKKVLIERIERATKRTAEGDKTDYGYRADAVTLEARTTSGVQLLTMVPLPIIDPSMLDKASEEAIENLTTGAQWTGTAPQPKAAPPSRQ